MSSLEKNRCAKCSMVVLEVFPMIMQNLMAHTGTQAKTLYTAIMRNAPFRRNLNKSELDMVDTLQTDEYTKIDVSLSYKIIVNFFQLSIPPPSRQWGAKPIDTEIGIGEDIERIRRERNSFVHRVNANISEALFDNFFVTFIEVGERIDAYLNNLPNDEYAYTIEQYRTCVLDLETEKKLLEARADIEQLEEKCSFHIGNPEKEIHIFAGKSTNAAIEKLGAEEDLEESYTKLKIIVHEVDDSEEVVKLINSLKEDLNSENIKCKGAEKGSIVLFIDVKNRVVLDDGLFQSEVSTFIQNLFKFCNLKCYFNTQTYAVIASAAEEFEEPITYMPEKATGTSSMGDKGHVVVNFEVKHKIFHSNDSLNRTLNEVFNTIVLKGNGTNLLGKTDVYAELVKPENTTTTEDAFTQAQTPVKYNLPVSVILRKQLNITKSSNEIMSINSCIKIGNTLVFTAVRTDRLIICNVDGTDIHDIPLYYPPYSITEIDSNTVAVSCVRNSTILIINISTRSVTSRIDNAGRCWGISYNDNNLYGVSGNRIYVMELTGKTIRTIPVSTNIIVDITVDRDRLVCIDGTTIYCCSLEGKLMWEFKKDGFQGFHCVTTDNEGNVYVTSRRTEPVIGVVNELNCYTRDMRTNTVIVVSDDGKQHRELLTKADGLRNPWGIYFDKKENSLLICNESIGKAFLFDVKKNKNKHE